MGEHYYSENPTSKFSIKEVEANIFSRKFPILTGSSVFSVGEIDWGTTILLNHCEVKDGQKILDLGCGYGIVGVSLGLEYPNSEIMMTDINKRAVSLARKNVKLNKLKNVKVKQGNMYEKIEDKFDVILLNPPQSAGREICFQMIIQAIDHLNDGGSLQIVARKNKGGKVLSQKMEEIFGNVKPLGKKSGFWVYVSYKR